MTLSLSTRVVMDDHPLGLLLVGPATALGAAGCFAVALLWGELAWPVRAAVLLTGLALGAFASWHVHGHLWIAVQRWQVGRALSRPAFRAALAARARDAALDHLATLPRDGFDAPSVLVDLEWHCRRADLTPMRARVVPEGLPDGASRPMFLDAPGLYTLLWAGGGVESLNPKPFTVHTTVGPFAVGTAHAQMAWAKMRLAG